jgi:hypothetical protein
VAGQANELNIIRQSLYDLESQHGRVRQQYEDELNRLRAELAAVRAQAGGGALPNGTPHPPPPGGPGLPPPGGPPFGGGPNDPFYRSPRSGDRDHGRLGDRPSLGGGGGIGSSRDPRDALPPLRSAKLERGAGGHDRLGGALLLLPSFPQLFGLNTPANAAR